jgi:transposase
VAREYRPVDRGQQFLLPPDLRDWLPQEHLAWFVLRVIEEMDTAPFHRLSRRGGVGRQGYDPQMLLAVLLYAYAVGVRSSRQVERLCQTDVAFRVLCAQDAPDHTTLARFRQAHESAFTHLFSEILLLCSRAGLGRLGLVAVDGTKMTADASRDATVDEQRARAAAEAVVAEAEEVDSAEDAQFGSARGDEVPQELVKGNSARRRIRQLLAERDAERAAQAATEQAEREAQQQAAQRAADDTAARRAVRVAKGEANLARARAKAQAQWDHWHQRDQASRTAGGGGLPGTRPVPPEQHSVVKQALGQLARARDAAQAAACASAGPSAPADADGQSDRSKPWRVNLTDPDSRIMRAPHGNGWVQGFNAQAAVSQDQIVLAAYVCDRPGDVEQFQPLTHHLQQAVARLRAAGQPAQIGTVLADAGYASEANLTAPGPDRLIALGRDPGGVARATDSEQRRKMRERLTSPDGKALYAKRSSTVEPVFGQIKHGRGLRRFTRRGLDAVNAEWQLITGTHNLLKLHKATLAT